MYNIFDFVIFARSHRMLYIIVIWFFLYKIKHWLLYIFKIRWYALFKRHFYLCNDRRGILLSSKVIFSIFIYCLRVVIILLHENNFISIPHERNPSLLSLRVFSHTVLIAWTSQSCWLFYTIETSCSCNEMTLYKMHSNFDRIKQVQRSNSRNTFLCKYANLCSFFRTHTRFTIIFYLRKIYTSLLI